MNRPVFKDEPPALADPGAAARAADMSVWVHDARSGVFTLAGPVLEQLGLPGPSASMPFDEWRARAPEADLAHLDSAVAQMWAGTAAEAEFRIRTQDGSLTWVKLRGGASEADETGAPVSLSGFVFDVGERRRLEARLLEREQQLSHAVHAGLIGVWVHDFSTGLQVVRGHVLQWLGKTLDDNTVFPSDWMKVIHPEDKLIAREAHDVLMSGDPVDKFDYRILSPQGWRWARVQGRPVEFDEDGKPSRAAGVMIDITAEREYAEALSQEKSRFEAVYRSTPAMLHSLDMDGRTTLISDHWLERMGYERKEVIGRHGWEFFVPEDAHRIREDVFPHVLEHGSIRNVALTAMARSGEMLELRLSAFLERDSQGRPVAAHGAFNEVTDLNEARRRLENHASELERANRELDRFAVVASHDMQEPLRKMSAFASMLRRRYEGRLDSEADQCLDFLTDAAGRMRRLIDDVLAYSRAANREIRSDPVDLDTVITETLTTLEMQIAEAGAHIETASPMPVVCGEESLLRLLFQNLISNAVKYRKGHGVRVTISAQRSDEGWLFTVADDGIGFDPKFSEKIFAPFQRLHTREDHEGTGIGLAICQQAVERHGGRIWVESKEGEGSRFHFTLPPGGAALADTAA